jgi:hypothetical protein
MNHMPMAFQAWLLESIQFHLQGELLVSSFFFFGSLVFPQDVLDFVALQFFSRVSNAGAFSNSSMDSLSVR